MKTNNKPLNPKMCVCSCDGAAAEYIQKCNPVGVGKLVQDSRSLCSLSLIPSLDPLAVAAAAVFRFSQQQLQRG